MASQKEKSGQYAQGGGSFADQGKEMASQAKETGSSVMEKAKDMGSSAVEKARDMASNVGHKVGDAASYVGHRAEDATSAVGSGMKSLAGNIREHTPQGGVLGTATGAVADTLESGGRYLEEHGLSGIGEDMTSLIRRNPIPAVLVGIGIGFLIARATRS